MGVPRGMPSDRVPPEDPQPIPHRRNQMIAIAIILMAIAVIAVLILL